jgi:hypothetical protein
MYDVWRDHILHLKSPNFQGVFRPILNRLEKLDTGTYDINLVWLYHKVVSNLGSDIFNATGALPTAVS